MQDAQALGAGWTAVAGGILRLVGFFGLIALFTPIFAVRRRWRKGPGAGNDPLKRVFYGYLIRAFGFKVRARGRLCQDSGVLFVSNHSSYLDVLVLGSLLEASFVAKAEVEGWPLVGLLCKEFDTVFIERRSMRAADQKESLGARLAQGQRLILFPEGTSSDGQRTLPFKSSLFGVAQRQADDDGRVVIVQPVSVVCTALGGLPVGRNWRPYYAWFGDMTLMGHLWNVLKIGRFTVDVLFHPPVSIRDFKDRKALAAWCHDQVARGVEACVTGRQEAFELLAPPAATLPFQALAAPSQPVSGVAAS